MCNLLIAKIIDAVVRYLSTVLYSCYTVQPGSEGAGNERNKRRLYSIISFRFGFNSVSLFVLQVKAESSRPSDTADTLLFRARVARRWRWCSTESRPVGRRARVPDPVSPRARRRPNPSFDRTSPQTQSRASIPRSTPAAPADFQRMALIVRSNQALSRTSR